MEKEYTILCDESEKRGAFFSNFYGGVIVGGSVYREAVERLMAAKETQKIESEIKWTKVGPYEVRRYEPVVREFFNLMGEGLVRMRVMFRQNIHEATSLTPDHYKNEYFLLYYQFLKHGFGLPHMPHHPEGVKLRFYLDQLPDQTREKMSQFRGYVCGLNYEPRIRKAGLVIAEEDVAEVDSKSHILLQCADLVLGSIPFRLNEKHLAKPEGKHRRGKRTVAKHALYKTILGEICRVTKKPHFNIGISTGIDGDYANRWSAPYLHWRFVPSEHRYAAEHTKQNKRKRPI